MPTPAVALYVPTYATREPYLTTAEYLAAPTGVDVSQLIPGATTEAANTAALATTIMSASGYADTICRQVLGATLDTQVGEYRIFTDGTIRVPVDYTPLVEVQGVSYGWYANGLTAMDDLSGLWLERKVVRIPIGPVLITGAGLVYSAPPRAGSIFAQVLYVNGYANTTLAADESAGASSITVASPLGIFPGLPMTIYDDAVALTEMVTVAGTYVQGSTTVPLVSPLVNAHSSGTAISALPRPVKQATIALTTHLIKTRGSESMALASVTGGPAMQKTMPGYTEEYDQALDLLMPFRRVM